MSDYDNSPDEEINLSELFVALWAQKILIIIVTSLSIFFAGYYVLTTEKEYTSKAIFKIEEENSRGLSLSSDLNSIAAIAGLRTASPSSLGLLLERIKGREFILEFSKELSLEKDPYFNSYDPDSVDPLWKATIKRLIGYQSVQADRNAIVERNILKSYLSLVDIEKTDAGAVSINVTHNNAKMAAKYANALMEQVRKMVVYENETQTRSRLAYLSEILGEALQELEATQQALKDYTLKNSVAAEENFLSGSLKLDTLRMERREVLEISEVLLIIEDIIKTNNLDNNSYKALRKKYPLVDDVSFRRILGMSETISAWVWPNLTTIQAVSLTLKDRLKRLDVEISNFEDKTKIYASSAENLAKLKKDATIAEASYTVLIEQVKSQSLAAGFKPDTFKLFQYATPPLSPSSPQKLIVVAIGTFLGLVLGCSLALVNSSRIGVYYTKSSILSDTKPSLALKSKSFRKISRWPIIKIIAYISKRRVSEIDQVEVMLASQKLIYVLNCGGRPTASGTARLLATQSSLSGRKAILCDQTGNSEKEIEGKSEQDISGLNIVKFEDNMHILKGSNGASFFTSSKFKANMEMLLSDHDQIFVCSSRAEGILGLMALKDFNPRIIVLARLRNTRKAQMREIIANHAIDVLFYE